MENADLTFKQYEKALVTFSASIIRNFEDAQDVVSEVFLECFENKKQVEKAYLFKAVRNRSLNKIRANNRFLKMMINLKDYWDAIFPFEVIRDDAGVWEMLTVLPARQKEVLLLRIKAELSILEISEVLKIPEGTVKSRLNKALGTLKKRFTE
ncbi:MAG: hypothetical protein A2381_01660 [Bdellovibrionales bacterium RIFOXYB1_FULL_37_110]|nr:MAG: hypothetical protein A2417_15855 [Bdellovibrionales bacterium RIFOXYC1_FULL_37_79]OFZ58922.1 MAG: hypothetical protein A2381_01660 [Bdellovibrionales bacterium RIFOXYB1_FULL_37_110]OFZ64632.1 MAG: hypothetical protein A2577_13275 [Bdellovibrionales bacterium RIFOXYD1_FULL_36_51]